MSDSPISVTGRYGRYDVYGELAAGGMGSVHLAVQVGSGGIDRLVAIKRLHPELVEDPEFVDMLRNEARVLARIRHSNVVAAHDAFELDGEAFLVMDFIEGETLNDLVAAAAGALPADVAAAIVVGILHGLHAAHEATNHRGEKLMLVHRDISPHNILVGFDGIARILDFGIARVANRVRETTKIFVNGKFGYMAPEQAQGVATHESDLFGVGVIFWELLVGQKLRKSKNIHDLADEIVAAVPPPSLRSGTVPQALDDVVRRACAPKPEDRYHTALEMARDIERCTPLASQWSVARYVNDVANSRRTHAQKLVRSVESRYPSQYPTIVDKDARPEDEEIVELADDEFVSVYEKLDFSHEPTIQLDMSELSLVSEFVGEATLVRRRRELAGLFGVEHPEKMDELPPPSVTPESSVAESLRSVLELLSAAAREKGFAAAFDDEVTQRIQLRTGLSDATQLEVPQRPTQPARLRPMPKRQVLTERYLVMRSLFDRPFLPSMAMADTPLPLVRRKHHEGTPTPETRRSASGHDTVRSGPRDPGDETPPTSPAPKATTATRPDGMPRPLPNIRPPDRRPPPIA